MYVLKFIEINAKRKKSILLYDNILGKESKLLHISFRLCLIFTRPTLISFHFYVYWINAISEENFTII